MLDLENLNIIVGTRVIISYITVLSSRQAHDGVQDTSSVLASKGTNPKESSHGSYLQTLRVISVGSLASAPRSAARRPGPPLPTTLPPLGRTSSSAAAPSTVVAAAVVTPTASTTSRPKLAVDEGESLLAIHADVALVRGLAVPVAAVGVRGVAVGLNLGRVGADEARRTGGELCSSLVFMSILGGGGDLHRRLGTFRLGRRGRTAIWDLP